MTQELSKPLQIYFKLEKKISLLNLTALLVQQLKPLGR